MEYLFIPASLVDSKKELAVQASNKDFVASLIIGTFCLTSLLAIWITRDATVRANDQKGFM
jgi:hypothetical protein